MKFKIFIIILFCLIISSCKTSSYNLGNPKSQIKEILGYPFGTVLEMEVEVVDGDNLGYKDYMGKYLFRVKKVENKIIKDSIVMYFEDLLLGDRFPNNHFKLYKHLYGEEAGMLTGKQIQEMERQYVGKTFRIAAYESGRFIGLPDNYLNYHRMPMSAPGFHFSNHLVIVWDLADTIQQEKFDTHYDQILMDLGKD